MATPRNRKVKPPKVIGAISQFAGALVGTAVVTGKRIVKTAAQAGGEPPAKPGKKSVRAPAKKKATVKPKVRKAKKKAAKNKHTGSAGKGKTPRKGSAQSPATKEAPG